MCWKPQAGRTCDDENIKVKIMGNVRKPRKLDSLTHQHFFPNEKA